MSRARPIVTEEHADGVCRDHIAQGVVSGGVQARGLPGGEGVDHAGAERDNGDGSDLVLQADQTSEYFGKVTESSEVFTNLLRRPNLTSAAIKPM